MKSSSVSVFWKPGSSRTTLANRTGVGGMSRRKRIHAKSSAHDMKRANT